MFNRLQKYFVSGLVVSLPIALTVYLFILLMQVADSILGRFIQPYFDNKFGFYFQGISILVSIGLIVFVGFLATNFFGRKIHNLFEKILLKLPFFKQVYPALKEMAVFLFSRERMGQFRHVVLIEYPRKGIYSIAFMTNESSQRLNEAVKNELCNVFIPSSPSPLTGFSYLVPKKDIIFTEIKIEDAFRFIVSGGVVNPE